MERRLSSYTGCLLGLAVGDGLGHGPERVNGFLPVSSYTQQAAYACNGLLVGLTRGQLTGTMAPPVRYIGLALSEWARKQLWRQGDRTFCWISRSPRLDYRRCAEPELLDLLAAGELGTMEDHAGTLPGAGALMTAPAAALFYDPARLRRKEIHRLGAEAAALTHGVPAAFLSAAALAHILSRIVFDGQEDLEQLTREAGAVLLSRFGREYHAARQVRSALKQARHLAKTADRVEALSRRAGPRAHQVLASALYICLTGAGSPESMLRTAAEVSPGCGAAAGAVLGALHGAEAIPEAWLEELECAAVLRELAGDLFGGCPMMLGSRIFDIEWDEKYNVAEL